MPRSSEARAAAAWAPGGHHPKPPKTLSRAARAEWRAIVECRPVDYFRPGSFVLLEQYCEVSVAQRAAMQALAERSDDPDVRRRVKDLAAIINSTAIKLRLSVQTEVDRKSAKLDEKVPGSSRFLRVAS